MDENNYEVNLISLMLYVLRQYKKIIIAALMAAVLLGAFGTAKTVIHNSKIVVTAAKQTEYEKTVADYDAKIANAQNDIEKQQENISNFETYKIESIMYNLDKDNTYVYEKYYFVDTNYYIIPDMNYQNINYTNTVGNLYVSFINATDTKQALSKELDIDEKYLTELYSIKYSDSLITLKVYGENEAFCQKIVDALDNHLSQIGEDITDTIVDQSLTPLSINKCLCYSETVENFIEGKNKTYNSYNTKIDTDNANIKQYQEDKEKYIDDFNSNYAQKSVSKAAIKNATIGLFIGMIGTIALYCVVYLFSDKVYNCADLKLKYNLLVLARLNKREKEDKICSFVSKLERRTISNLEECCQLAVNNINGLGLNPKSIFVTGDVKEERLQEISNGLKAIYKDVELAYGRDFINDADSTEKLNKADYAVIVAESNISNYSFVNSQLEKLKEISKNAGCIVVE